MNLGAVFQLSKLQRIALSMQRNAQGFLPVCQDALHRLSTEVDSSDRCVSYFPDQKKLYKFKIDTQTKRLEAEIYEQAEDAGNYELVDNKSVIELLKSKALRNVLYIPNQDTLVADVLLNQTTLLAGSFNPLHQGHVQMMKRGMDTSHSGLGVYELSISNCSKGEFGDQELYRRTLLFKEESGLLLLTDAAFFREKAAFVSQQSWFCIGADTYKRFFDPQYYESEDQIKEFASLLKSRDIGLLVAPRLAGEKVESVDDYIQRVPDLYKDKVLHIPNFRVDISSTQIRSARTQQTSAK